MFRSYDNNVVFDMRINKKYDLVLVNTLFSRVIQAAIWVGHHYSGAIELPPVDSRKQFE